MGSHGGATAEGQVAVLHSLGITEEAVGCPIRSSMDTVQIGVTGQGIPVLIDRLAAAADGIVVVNRIKAHTEYTGPVESGWMKMLTIGLGKHQGALMAHRNAVQITYREAIVAVAREIIRRAPLLFGLGLVENAYDQTAEVVAAWPQDFEETEMAMLRRAKALMPRLPFDKLDILIVDEIGKEISGSGMDPNVIGRRMVFGEPEPPGPSIIRIVAPRPQREHLWQRHRHGPGRFHHPEAGGQAGPPADVHQLPHRHDAGEGPRSPWPVAPIERRWSGPSLPSAPSCRKRRGSCASATPCTRSASTPLARCCRRSRPTRG